MSSTSNRCQRGDNYGTLRLSGFNRPGLTQGVTRVSGVLDHLIKRSNRAFDERLMGVCTSSVSSNPEWKLGLVQE
jgi:hypothetical protein